MSYVYLIQSDRYFKIGIANDVESRLSQLQTGNPNELVIESCYEFPNAQAVETVLHQKFSSVRKLGEWFLLSNTGLQEFDTLCEMLGGVRYSPTAITSTPNEIEEAEEESAKLYYFNCDASGNHYVYTIDPNQKEPNGRKKRVYLWKFDDPRTQENCPDEATRWSKSHVCTKKEYEQ
jgi:hypothetical protein